jgi:hypothetical protein
VVAQRLDALLGVEEMVEDFLLLKMLASVSDMMAPGQVVLRGIHADGLAEGPTPVTARWHAREA